jgi:hypothetical protein
MICLNCNIQLIGRQKKFCSSKCRMTQVNIKYQNYAAQQERGIARKTLLVKQNGGKCNICGYDKNMSALCFHHLSEHEKKFQITIRECSNNSMKRLHEESLKCILLCHNCHMETHYPQYSKVVGPPGFEPETNDL